MLIGIFFGMNVMRNFVGLVAVLGIVLGAEGAKAAVQPDYAMNVYQNHELSRAEQRCIDEGYKITYANCQNQTAPTERCPHHDAYYKSCSQEAWCKNNNYTFAEEDCKAPFYPFKMCANKYPLYRICKEDIARACKVAGFESKDKCQLTEKKCPFSPDWGECCGACERFAYELDKLPAGYVADGETCVTCAGVVKTNVKAAPCDGFVECKYGPMSARTESCQKAQVMLYRACKTSADVCRESGYTQNRCLPTDDVRECPQNKEFKHCKINCLKYAKEDNPGADVIGTDVTDPMLDLTKMKLMSLVDMQEASCQNQTRPEITLHINNQNIDMYENLLDREIENVSIRLIFEDAIELNANGKFKNVKIKAEGNMPECPLRGLMIEVDGVVSFGGIEKLCASFRVAEKAKLIADGGVAGDVELDKDASLGLKGDLVGKLTTKSFAEVLIKGKLVANDEDNFEAEKTSVEFGCNSKVKIEGGIEANAATVLIRQWSVLDTPSVKFVSAGEKVSGMHMYQYVKIYNAYGETVFPIVENATCDDMYYMQESATAENRRREITLEPSNLMSDLWKCQERNSKQLDCN